MGNFKVLNLFWLKTWEGTYFFFFFPSYAQQGGARNLFSPWSHPKAKHYRSLWIINKALAIIETILIHITNDHR